MEKKSRTSPNLKDYEHACATFDWQGCKGEIDFFANNKLNAAYNAIDRHLHKGRTNKPALYAVDESGSLKKLTFGEIASLSNRLANGLRALGIKKGDRVFVFLPRICELYISIIAIAKLGAIVGPLFSAFGPDALRDRLIDSGAKAIITSSVLKKKLLSIRHELKDLQHVIVVRETDSANEISYEKLMEASTDSAIYEPMSAEDPLYLLYTSGTTGKPKGVVHAHGDIVGHHMTAKWVLDLKEDDIYWCTADPGWVTGTVYGIFAPWSNGVSVVAFEGRFSAEDWYHLIEKLKITVWYTAPTALRMLMKAGLDIVEAHNLNSLRYIASVGEPLNPEVIRWGKQAFGLSIYDNWWQTETGMQLIANLPCLPIKPGSMGKPVPGIYATIVDDSGAELEPHKLGRLVIKPGWPAMLKGIWHNEAKFREYFQINGWYASGDNAWKDEDGYFWFVGRADDVINSAGHRVGPFEVESALLEHEAVAEAGVIGKPDPERGEIIKAFVVLKNGVTSSAKLIEELQNHTRTQLAAHAYPREIEIRQNLPKTRSGKIMRRLLKAWELGLPTGDISALEDE